MYVCQYFIVYEAGYFQVVRGQFGPEWECGELLSIGLITGIIVIIINIIVNTGITIVVIILIIIC